MSRTLLELWNAVEDTAAAAAEAAGLMPPSAPAADDAGTCQCEAEACTHAYLSAPAEPGTRCDYVGPVCLACATTHLRPYMISILFEGTGYRP